MKLEVKKLNQKYPSGEKALSDVSFATDGILAVVGGEKSGKTSLLRCLAGLESFSGEVLLNGEKLQNIPPECRDIQLFFENFDVFERKTVFYNIAYPLKLRGEKHSEVKRKTEAAAKEFGLETLLNFKAKRLTYDQKRAVALARLFVRDAKFTLLDDPTSNFSNKVSDEIFSSLKKAVKRKDGVVVYAARNVGEAFEIADKAVFLSFGQVKQTGSMDDMYRRPNFVVVAKAFGDYNVLSSTLEREGEKLFVTLFGLKICLPFCVGDLLSEEYAGKNVLVGFRFSDVKLMPASETKISDETYEIVDYLRKNGKYVAKIQTNDGFVFAETDNDSTGSAGIYVDARGINLFDATSEGNLIFG